MNQRVYSLAECVHLARVVPRRPPTAVVGTVITIALLLGTVIAWAALTEADLVVRGPARVRARVAPRIAFSSSSGEQVFALSPGRIAQVLVTEGAPVQAGDLVAVLDTTERANDVARLASALDAARGRHTAAVRMLELAEARFTAARAAREAELAQVTGDDSRSRRRTSADVRMARSALAASQREARRTRDLEVDGAASRRQVDDAAAQVAEARARVDAARAGGSADRGELVRRQDAAATSEWAVQQHELSERVAATAAEADAAEHVLANAQLELERASIHADVTGTVSAVMVGAGDPVQAGQGVVTIVPAGGLRIDAAVAAADIAELRVGMRARVRLDAFDWQRYGTLGGTIAQIGTDAELVGPPGREVPIYVVRVDVDAEQIGRGTDRGALKLGMTGTVEIVTGSDSLLALLFGRIRHAVSL